MSSSSADWVVRVNCTIRREVAASPAAAEVAGMFFPAEAAAMEERLYEDFELALAPGKIIVVMGPSGAGKSVLLAAAAKQVKDAIVLDAEPLCRRKDAAVDCLVGLTLEERLGLLGRCGLAEATAMVTPAGRLSGGQRYRLALAAALAEARLRGRPTLVIADEFASNLDPATAEMLGAAVRKLVGGSGVGLLAATVHEAAAAVLRPDEVITKGLGEPPRRQELLRRGGLLAGLGRWPIVRGSLADYEAMARFHYLAGPPAAHKRVWALRPPRQAVRRGAPSVAAVLVVSPPLLNVRGRNAATAGRYCLADRPGGTELLNREMECISRVIVHPVFRGAHLAVRLVRHAVATAATPLVEALAAMGRVHPFFERAGMTAYRLGPDVVAERLLSATEAVGLSAAEVAAIEPVKAAARRRDSRGRFLRAELAWCNREINESRVKGHAVSGRLSDVEIACACRHACRSYVYYLAKRKGTQWRG